MVLYAIPRSGAPKSAVIRLGSVVVTVALAAVTIYYVIQTGDSGARSVWG
jgi:hypothetical protein